MILSRQHSHLLSPSPMPSKPNPPHPRGERLDITTSHPYTTMDFSPPSPSLSSSPTSLPVPLSPHSKTTAFFSSPPSPISSDLPPVPTNPLRPSGSRTLTADFFSSPPSYPRPGSSLRSVSPVSLSSRSDSGSSIETPEDAPLAIISPPASSQDTLSESMSKTDSFFSSSMTSSGRSLTADFFSASFTARPTPTPSLRSVASNTSLSSQSSHSSYASQQDDFTPKPRTTLPPLARLFPSRYVSHRDEHDALTAGGVLSRSPPRRTFVDIDDGAPEGIFVSSPTSAEVSPHEPHGRPSPHKFDVGSTLNSPEGATSYTLVKEIGQGAFSRVWMASSDAGGEVVAVKILSRPEGHHSRHKTRVERAAFQREVDVLRHLSSAAHASLPTLHSAFSLVASDVLVIEYVGGGELLELVNSDDAHAALTETVLQRMWLELVDVLAWIHERNVVHRDVKLENILLVTPTPSADTPTPLIKLMDFGLARAIDPADPWLRTRCGSESYAAPELLLTSSISASDDDEDDGLITYKHLSRAPTDGGRHRVSRIGAGHPHGPSQVPRKEGTYDGRETDAWALGVVLFALATRGLPFDPPPELEEHLPVGASMRVRERRERERRAWAMRVVKGEVVWPDAEMTRAPSPADDGHGESEVELTEEPRGVALAGLPAVRRIVGRLLVRDPRRRAKVGELVGVWGDAPDLP